MTVFSLVIAGVLVAFSGVAAAQNAQQAQPAAPAVAPGAAALAEHLAQMAQMSVASRAITPETLRQSIALLQAAARLNPSESRFPRLLAEAALQAGDTQSAIDAYTALVRLDPNNRVAQIRLIELYSGRLESADARLRYLVGDGESRAGVYNTERIPAEVRSHAALLASQIYFERAQTSDGTAMLEESLRLFPLNPEALRLKYELSGDRGTPRQRLALLLQMLRANPAQPGVMAKVGQELADAGLNEQSLSWYSSAFSLAQRVGRGVSGQDFDRYAAQLVIAGSAASALQLAGGVLENDPADIDAALVALLVERRSGDEERLKNAMLRAEQALLMRAVAIGRTLRGEEPPAAEQADQPPQVDVPGDIRMLLEHGDSAMINAYASTLADLAWLRVYFQQDAQGAVQVMNQLRQLLPPDSITMARLEGWAYLVAGQVQEARVKLSAVADRDPLAALGMIRLAEREQPDRATEEARRLMDDNPSGLLGAIIHDALRDKKPRLAPGEQAPLSARGQEVNAELEQFPRDWLDFIDRPSSFYFVRGEPLKVAHRFGEPIIARVIIRNIGHHDITVGPEGAIRPDLWFDVQLRGAFSDFIPGVSFDRMTQHVVLRRHEQIVQTVRVDQSRLAQILQSNASATLPLYFSVFTNPITTQQNIVPGPGGQRQLFSKPVERTGVNVDRKHIQNTMTQLQADLASQNNEVRIRALQTLAWFAQQLAQAAEEEDRARATQMVATIHQATNDRDPHIRAAAGFLMGRMMMGDPQQRRQVIDQMLRDPSWEARLLGLLLAQSMEVDQWKPIAAPLAQSDPEPLVRQFAQAVVDFADNPAAAQPATEPADAEQASPIAVP